MTRQLLFIVFVSVTVLLIGCGERVGPSNNKARLDFEDYLNNSYQRVLLLDSFSVDSFKTLSEDRIEMDVTIVLKIDANMESQIENYRDPFGGYSSHPASRSLRKAQRITNLGESEPLTLRYKLNPNGLWIFQGFSRQT